MTDTSTPRDTHETPDGWTREEIVAGMDTVGISDHFDEFLGLGSAYKCRRCEHYIPIDALDDDTCPRCERSGMTGTVIMGRQDVTAMFPDGWFDKEDDGLFTDGGHNPEDHPDPEDDPFACSQCGGYLGELERMNGSYCESCKVETEPHVVCEECGDRLPQSRASNLDVSPDDEYYPEFIYFCPTHAPGTGDQELVTDGGEDGLDHLSMLYPEIVDEAMHTEEPVTDIQESGEHRTIYRAVQYDPGEETVWRADILVDDHPEYESTPSVSFAKCYPHSDVKVSRDWTPLATGSLLGPQDLPEWESLFTVFNSALGLYQRESRDNEKRLVTDGGTPRDTHEERPSKPYYYARGVARRLAEDIGGVDERGDLDAVLAAVDRQDIIEDMRSHNWSQEDAEDGVERLYAEHDEELVTDGGTPRDQETDGGVAQHPLPYAGSKRQLASWIVDNMANHRCYVEPFCGSCAVLASKPRSAVETVNDTNTLLTMLLRVLRDQPDALVEWLKQTPYARSEYEHAAALVDGRRTPESELSGAGYYALFVMANHGSKPATPAGFARESASRGGSVARMYQGRIERLAVLADRLQGVAIESRDWQAVVESHDDPDTLIYLDPPYPDTADQVGGPIDYGALAEILQSIESADWMLSYPTVPEWASHLPTVAKNHSHRIGRDGHTSVTEHLICSYDVEERELVGGSASTLSEWGDASE